MKKNKGHAYRQSGFTLIELLVVVAIIGLITRVIIASITTARIKSADSGIKINLTNLKAQSGLYYDTNYNSYGTYAGGPCPSTDNTNSSSVGLFYDNNVKKAITQAATQAGGTISNGSSSTAVISKSTCIITNSSSWTAAVVLKSDTTQAWCVDSSGNSKQETITSDAPNTAYITSGTPVVTNCK